MSHGPPSVTFTTQRRLSWQNVFDATPHTHTHGSHRVPQAQATPGAPPTRAVERPARPLGPQRSRHLERAHCFIQVRLHSGVQRQLARLVCNPRTRDATSIRSVPLRRAAFRRAGLHVTPRTFCSWGAHLKILRYRQVQARRAVDLSARGNALGAYALLHLHQTQTSEASPREGSGGGPVLQSGGRWRRAGRGSCGGVSRAFSGRDSRGVVLACWRERFDAVEETCLDAGRACLENEHCAARCVVRGQRCGVTDAPSRMCSGQRGHTKLI
ncbi:uncharacterized protein CC84DRAFT_417020 [Paraphaeosphaeria sporulosa]|uniref:Uncharacterized protein n=1 Tax=Paraphaeosphaeria sporulosa TaxID=1460663 RepID=A0A177BUH2_9PLEO|nr:uncharacterized protein CC84DRAFT_417020 [Paraphaeosphaeria sporulosa]OAF99103.1 hypothetical protein CC84DRAFT_417020 [Paraphaeosphaeria sporulosa]